jgi:hypothetical protein
MTARLSSAIGGAGAPVIDVYVPDLAQRFAAAVRLIAAGGGVQMHDAYLEVISLVERLHRHVLELVKLKLDGGGIYDINAVQALMLFNVGGPR